MNLDYYKVFYEVANAGSITEASKNLYISQPAVTKTIKNLEASLGGQLFNRNPRGIELTTEGKILFDYIKDGITSFKLGEQKFKEALNLEIGTIRIGANATIFSKLIAPYIQKFSEIYPNINIEINADKTTNLIEMVRKNHLDIAFINDSNDNHEGIEIKNMFKTNYCFIKGPKYQNIKIEKLEDLKEHKLIFEKKGTMTRKCLDKFLSENNIELESNLDIASSSSVVAMTKINQGIGFAVKEFIKEEIENKELEIIELKEGHPTNYISYVVPEGNNSNYTKALIDIIKP